MLPLVNKELLLYYLINELMLRQNNTRKQQIVKGNKDVDNKE